MKSINLKFFVKSIFLATLITVLLLGVASYLFTQYFLRDIPEISDLANRTVIETSTIYDRTSTHILYELHGDVHRKILSPEEIPDIVRIATIAAEDGSFYQHKGYDLQSIARAAKANVGTQSLSQGASTITQQLARNIFLSRERTFERKIKEVILARKIEKVLTKSEILNMYLNEISYGSNIHGVGTASEYYFGKNASDLTLGESAMLAALLKAPTTYSPHGNNTSELSKRRRYVLERISLLGLASDEQVETALKEPIRVIAPKSSIKAPHFVFHVIDQLKNVLDEETIAKGGLQIITTLDYDLQKEAQEMVEKWALSNEKKFQAENASLVAIDPKTGELLAMVGSRNYFDEKIDGKVNVATSMRQPGSAFKPIVYAKAFEKGYQPETLLYDVKTNFGPDGSGKDYVPRNYNESFQGIVSMRQALAMSLNVPAVKTLYLADVEETIDFAKSLGISTLTRTNTYGLSLVLGGGDVTLLEATASYGVFANEGTLSQTTAIRKISKINSEVLFEHKMNKKSVVSIQTARKINSILSDNKARSPVFGSRNSLNLPTRTVAAKTGTTQEYRDAWTIGYTPSLAVGVWAGNNNNSPMKNGSAGIFVAAPLWSEFIDSALTNKPTEEFITYEKVESDTFMVSGKVEESIAYFKKGSGKKISEEKAKKTKAKKIDTRTEPIAHSILYYANRNNPLEPAKTTQNQSTTDPMLERWEFAINDQENELNEF